MGPKTTLIPNELVWTKNTETFCDSPKKDLFLFFGWTIPFLKYTLQPIMF